MEFEFPDTGEGVTEGKFLEWLVDEGDEVEEDQVVAEAETDKAVVDIPAPADGVVSELKVKPGDTVEVGQVIMALDEGAEEESVEKSKTEELKDKGSEDNKSKTDEEGSVTSSSGDVLALPKVRKLAEEKGVDLDSLEIEGRITEKDVMEAAGKETEKDTESSEQKEKSKEESKQPEGSEDNDKQVKATPSVRKLAREKEVDIHSIEGSGRGGKVTRDNVLDAASTEPETEETDTEEEEPEQQEKVRESIEEETHSVDTNADVERVEMSGVRQQIANEMAESRFTAPHVTHIDTVDVEELVEFREERKEEVDVHLTYMPFIMKAAQIALEKFPDLNAELDEEENEIVRYNSYGFNIAVDTDRGLMVPLLEDVDEKSILELAEEIGDLAGAARNGDLGANKMENGTFSITNLGVIGGEAFTPIINHPQIAILGFGEIKETAEVVDGRVRPRHTMKVSLSYDHRVVDGATSARFVNELKENLENPEEMMLRL